MILTYEVKSKALIKSKVKILEKPVPEPPREEPYALWKKRPMQVGSRDHPGLRTPATKEEWEESEKEADPVRKATAKAADEDLIEVRSANVFEHMSEEDLSVLGLLIEINVDRYETHVVATFEHGYVLVYKIIKPLQIAKEKTTGDWNLRLLNRLGPYGSSQ